ncbi:MAG: MBL fold metallo-hydrolase [Sphingobacteriales bacterium 17-39-43]|uniref:MBL fold metallo-hydrolase n=1 Tax=Daejeonella sp. TaxID=2805397 RepID=UPI000BCE0073|nr:MBL fold metallo-hydrolase [Daejeonella sp.]MCF8454113.1 MBL fold metallo-hydrolase [Pedobacter sp.]OYX96308.1 MAG: MBL fold metallo-hydrolase [Sphingobacteriia bacterium 35-40-5]OYZ33175.1 MAG: MBL fold metallo-hydrolase [Sphingobacteriales bacterium 16-39-50]OZA26584.1 MAG: MBL fold metallo-hydrolase [Sphingobacteriales bacterium 17-39-43]OZA61295.1 MAG: MBL fold metallo-hydrolase [Sphingobacteriales bacterium 39-40-5]
MKITFLGTGTSQGVPVIACDCAVCSSKSKHDKRLRVSVLIEDQGKALVIDAGPDFRYQMLRAGVKHLDAILFTHEHKDHVAGLDDVRAFNHKQQSEIDIYAHIRVQEALRKEFHYIFSGNNYPGIPRLSLNTIEENQTFDVSGISVMPISVMHFKLPVFGFRIGGFTYITDANSISEEEKLKIKGSELLVINALQKTKHISHFTLDEALQLAAEIGAKKTYITHISHNMGTHREVSKELPEGVFLAYDGLELLIDS